MTTKSPDPQKSKSKVNIGDVKDGIRDATFAGRDVTYIINYFGGPKKAVESLVNSLEELAEYHEHINEWKELHNLLQELHKDIHQFRTEVERWFYQSKIVEVNLLRVHWSPCRGSIYALIDFAENVKYIWQESYREDRDNLYGPPWAVKIVLQQRNIEAFFKDEIFNVREIYDLADQLFHICYRELYMADKNLRNEASKLCELSNHILGKLAE